MPASPGLVVGLKPVPATLIFTPSAYDAALTAAVTAGVAVTIVAPMSPGRFASPLVVK